MNRRLPESDGNDKGKNRRGEQKASGKQIERKKKEQVREEGGRRENVGEARERRKK